MSTLAVAPGSTAATWTPTAYLPVEMSGVWATYGRGAVALKDVSLRVAPGERRAIVGASGSGKSTLLKLLKGLLSPARGEVRTLGVSLEERDAKRRLGARVGYIPQNLGLVNGSTVLENALMGALHRTGTLRSWSGVFASDEYDAAHEALETVGLAPLSHRRAHQLSGGERRRLAVARALVQRPELLLADEFLSELDSLTAGQVLEALEAAREKYDMTLVMVEHNLGVVCSFCDHVSVLREGTLVAETACCLVDECALRDLFRARPAA
ncbi:MAG TPA: ATP-binding cassette domain-containing protein [Longimicrobiaceae bacterium]|nr:ATP-binding cassette domain-containing protein [Longimicrobiaceae bacterium]